LSQRPMASRPLPAGPLTPLEGPQLQQRLSLRYAIATGDVDPYALADRVLVPLRVAGAGGVSRGTTAAPVDHAAVADLPATGSALEIDGAVVSSVQREGGGLVVRVFNPDGEPAEVDLG